MQLYARLGNLSFVQHRHLDIKPELNNEAHLDLARAEILKINAYKAPRDKLVCILNACKVVTNLLQSFGGVFGADEFFPLLVLVVLKANPPHLHSNIEYIRRYRSPDKLVEE